MTHVLRGSSKNARYTMLSNISKTFEMFAKYSLSRLVMCLAPAVIEESAGAVFRGEQD